MKMRNNNQAIIKRITGRTLSSDKRRNFFVIAAIILTTFMIASVFSIGISYYESINMREKRMQGSVSHMAFANPTDVQMENLYSLDYVKTIGTGAYIAQTSDFPKLNNLDIGYVDRTQWKEMFCPAFTNIIGHYAEQENEIMLSRYIIDAMGIENPEIGMEIPISFIVNDTDEVITETFVLSCIYTEYASVVGNKSIVIYSSRVFAERYNKLTNGNISVNVTFKDSKHVDENIEKLKHDLAFSENQPYVQSPAFNDNYGNVTTYTAWCAIIVFMMFTGYLLIYNVMYISVSKDVRFYGLLKTLGTTPKQLRRIVTGQIMRLCLIGIPVGCAVSAAVSLLIVPEVLSNSSGFNTGTVVSFSPLIYIGAVLFVVLTALIGAVTPAKKAANVSPVEALKFTGENIHKSGVHSSANGKPYKIAFRNIFRDRKRAMIVILSLFLGIMIFTSIMTIVTSMDIDKFVDSQYDYDFSFSTNNMNNINSYSLNEDFVNEVRGLSGVKETAATTLELAELSYSETLNKYVNWDCEKYGVTEKDVIINNTFKWSHAIKGIDPLILREINKMLPVPIDEEAFERGEIALINITDASMADCFTDVSTLDLKLEASGKSLQITVDNVVFLKRAMVGYVITFSEMEILVSNTFLRQYSSEPKTLYLDINVENGYDEQVYNAISEIINPSEVRMDSRYEGRKAMQDAKTVMFVLGGGVSLILGFIGVFNFINVMSVGIMSRKRELAALESIGMSKRQMRSMLRNEGVGYASITLLCSVTLGNLITYGLFSLFKRIADYAEFTYPIIPVVIMCAVIFLICIITPEIIYKGISKMTLVERLREAE